MTSDRTSHELPQASTLHHATTEPVRGGRRDQMRRFTRSRWSLVAFATGLVVLLSGCGDKPMDTLAPAGPNASRINELFWIVTAIAIVILVLVAGAYAWIAIKFRAKPPEDGEQGIAGPYADEEFPTQIHGNTKDRKSVV